MKVLKIGALRASDISGDACEDCWRNISHFPCAMLKGEDEEMREAARLLYKECEVVPAGTKARIAELEAENKRLREALREIAEMEAGSHEPSFEMRGCMTSESCMNCDEMIDIASKALEGEE